MYIRDFVPSAHLLVTGSTRYAGGLAMPGEELLAEG